MSSDVNLPLEVELVMTAWDNAKKNLFDADDTIIDFETGEVAADENISDDLIDILMDIDYRLMDLISYYREHGAAAADTADMAEVT